MCSDKIKGLPDDEHLRTDVSDADGIDQLTTDHSIDLTGESTVQLTEIQLTINGQEYHLKVDYETRLIDLIRDEIGLTGTKEGCGKGECGTCTVIMDGKTVNSCLVLAFQAHGKEILTIEGMGTPTQLHPIQEAFIRNGAVQCGYCIPGMVLSTKALLEKYRQPTELQIRRGISGNLCRCTGYQKIVDAIQEAAQIMGGEKDER